MHPPLYSSNILNQLIIHNAQIRNRNHYIRVKTNNTNQIQKSNQKILKNRNQEEKKKERGRERDGAATLNEEDKGGIEQSGFRRLVLRQYLAAATA